MLSIALRCSLDLRMCWWVSWRMLVGELAHVRVGVGELAHVRVGVC
jgi:hypothetical protein